MIPSGDNRVHSRHQQMDNIPEERSKDSAIMSINNASDIRYEWFLGLAESLGIGL